jgi:hypothetical protein
MGLRIQGGAITATIIGRLGGWVRDAGTATVRLWTAADQVAVGTATAVAARKLTILTTGANQGIRVSTTLTTDNVIDALNLAEANATFSLTGLGTTRWGAGGASALDTRLLRSAAAQLALDDGAAGAASLVGGADNTLTLGTAAASGRRLAAVNSVAFYAMASVGAGVQQTYGMHASTGFTGGAGGVTATDCVLSRGAADRWTSGLNDSMEVAGTGLLAHRTALADAQPTATLGVGSIGLGQGGATAVAWHLNVNATTGTTRADMDLNGSLNALGTGLFAHRTLAADAQPTATFGVSAVALGAGGGTALDTRLQRTGVATLSIDNNAAGAATVVPVTDALGNFGTATLRWLTMIANTHKVFNASADANASASLQTSALLLGVGGATALDTRVARTGTKILTLDDGTAGAITTKPLGTLQTQARVVQTAYGTATPYTMDSGAAPDDYIGRDATGGNKVVLLLPAVTGRQVTVKNTALVAVVNTVAATPNGAETIDGVAGALLLLGNVSITLTGETGVGWHGS